jgi:hypothetical protein
MLIEAPWTEKQVENLRVWQSSRWVHPFTCANRSVGNHKETTDLGVLTPTTDGWTCESCDYRQNWAHDFMLRDHDGDMNPFPPKGGVANE